MTKDRKEELIQVAYDLIDRGLPDDMIIKIIQIQAGVQTEEEAKNITMLAENRF